MEPKVILITGGVSGLGAGVATDMAQHGWSVMATRRVPGETTFAPGPDGVEYVTAEMRDPASLRHAVDATLSRFGRIDALFCNAAVQGIGALGDLTREEWDETLAINLTAPFLLAQAAAPALAQSGGVVVLAASVHAERAAPGRLAYAASKAGLIALGRNLAAEFGASGARAVTLVLGPHNSAAMQQAAQRFFPDLEVDAALDAFAAMQPLGKIGEASQVAGTIRYLCSPAAAFVTGTEVRIDGGQSTRLLIPTPEKKS